VPGRPDRTLFAWDHWVRDPRKHAMRDAIWLSAQVDAEDVDAMSQLRSGVAAAGSSRTRFSPAHEAGPHWFHRLVAEGVAARDPAPA
jgi:hypothetical protein